MKKKPVKESFPEISGIATNMGFFPDIADFPTKTG